MKEGDKVSYINDYILEHGIIKSIDGDYAFVVYKCNDDWDNYKDYTGVRTPISNLFLGWVKNN